MSDNELWEEDPKGWKDDPKGYDGWLKPHQEDDGGERAVACYSRSSSWYFVAKLTLVGFLICYVFFQDTFRSSPERDLFGLCSAVFLISALISFTASILWDREFDKELDKLYHSDTDIS